jgi:hypothetical protein
MSYTRNQKTEILKFLSQYPFEEVYFSKDCFSQILIINYATQDVTLRDFCEHTIHEIITSKGFKDKEINSKWRAFLDGL